jgi:hypothetical protein
MRCLIFGFACLLGITSAQAGVFNIRAYKPEDIKQPSVIVKPLDAPGNPYAGQYSEYDRWAVEHYNMYVTPENDYFWQLGLAQAQGFHPSGGSPSDNPVDVSRGLSLIFTAVDDNGFVVPHGYRAPDDLPDDYVSTVAESLAHTEASQKQPAAGHSTGFWSLGFMEQSVHDAADRLTEKMWARDYPPIAPWMVAQNKDTVLLPDGGAIFIGDSRFAPQGVTGRWYIQRIGADGALQRGMLVDSPYSWNRILSSRTIDNPYFRKYELTLATGEKTSYNNILGLGGRYTVYRDRDNGGALAVVDFWQDRLYTPQQDGADFLDKLTIDWRYFQPIEAQRLARIYMLQQGQL